MKYLILAVLLAVAQALSPVPGRAIQNSANDKHETKDGASADTKPTANSMAVNHSIKKTVADQKPTGPNGDETKKSKVEVSQLPLEWSPHKDVFDYVGWVFGIVLALAGIIGVCFAYRTLKILTRQTKAAMDTAKAARLNAQAIINSERAWMIPRITQPDDREVMSPDEQGPDWKLTIEVRVTNCGKTPALVIGSLMELSSVKIESHMARSLVLALPEPPQYDNSEPGAPFAPGAIYVSGKFTRMYADIFRDDLIAGKPAWESGEKCLCIKGFIDYVDAFKQPHKTRFCYAYQTVSDLKAPEYRITKEPPRAREFRKAGPDVYNEMT
jgi:hypothetical protein